MPTTPSHRSRARNGRWTLTTARNLPGGARIKMKGWTESFRDFAEATYQRLTSLLPVFAEAIYQRCFCISMTLRKLRERSIFNGTDVGGRSVFVHYLHSLVLTTFSTLPVADCLVSGKSLLPMKPYFTDRGFESALTVFENKRWRELLFLCI